MRCLVLAEASGSIERDDSLTKKSLDGFVSVAESFDTIGQVFSHSSVKKIRDSPFWKWEGPGARRVIFAVMSTPRRRVLYTLVVAAYPHHIYEEHYKAHSYQNTSIEALQRLAEVLSFEDELDRAETIAKPIPADYIGLARPLAMLDPVSSDLVLEESTGWVERILPQVAADPGGFGPTIEPVLEAIVARRESEHEVLGTDVRVTVAGRVVSIALRDEPPGRARRRIPLGTRPDELGFLTECELASAGHVDPFLVWEETQRDLLIRLGSAPKSLPAFVDGPGGSGKTAILMWIVRGVIQHADWYAPGTRIRFVTESKSLVPKMVEGLANHLRLVDGAGRTEAREIASDVCRTVDSHLIEYLPDVVAERFRDDTRKVAWPRFRRWYGSLRMSTPLTAHEAWCAIRILIRGDSETRDDPRFDLSPDAFDEHVRNWFRGLNERHRQGLNDEQLAHALVVHRSYMAWMSAQVLWDETDLVRAVTDSFRAGPADSGPADLLVVDEAQDLTPDVLRLFVRTCGASRFRADVLAAEGRPVRIPMIFAADDLQTINPSGFDWNGFRAVFFEETAGILNTGDGINVEPIALQTNFRMRENVHSIAHGLRRWMRPQIGDMTPLTERDGGFSGPWMSPPTGELRDVLKEVERIIVPDDFQDVPRDDRSPGQGGLYDFLHSHGVNIEERVIAVGQTKGDEYSTVALVGFGSAVRNAESELSSKYVRQTTYVAASRARDAAVWLEVNDDDLAWFWDARTDRGPGRYLGQPLEFSPGLLDPFKVSAEQQVAREMQRLLRIIAASEDDDETRADQAANAAGGLRSAGESKKADAALALSRYFRGERSPFTWGILPPDVDAALILAASESSDWEIFAGPHLSNPPLDVLAGWAVHSLKKNSALGLIDACTEMDRAGFTSLADVSVVIATELRSAGEFLTDMLTAEAADSDLSLFGKITPAVLIVLDVLSDGIMLGERFTVLRDWASGDVASALRGCARLANAGDEITGLAINRRIVAVESGATWLGDGAVSAARVSTKMSDDQILLILEEACRNVCAQRDVQERMMREAESGVHRYTDTQLLRLMQMSTHRLAEEIEQTNMESAR